MRNVTFAILLLAPLLAHAAGTDPRLAESRALTQDFQKQLKGALMKAMKAGGPVKAIGVCKVEAPEIAARLSRRSGAQVSRTALRVRNPANAPRPWQKSVMQRWQKELAQGDQPSSLVYFKTRSDGGARFMGPIMTGPLCLTCHGANVSPAVKKALAKNYPEDRATGFKAGDLRGAFSIIWPAGSAKQGDSAS